MQENIQAIEHPKNSSNIKVLSKLSDFKTMNENTDNNSVDIDVIEEQSVKKRISSDVAQKLKMEKKNVFKLKKQQITVVRYHQHSEPNRKSHTKKIFHKQIADFLHSRGIKKANILQSYAWPHLLRGNSLAVISDAVTGKKLCYIPAICERIVFYAKKFENQAVSGPMAIIIVSNEMVCNQVATICNELLQNTDAVRSEDNIVIADTSNLDFNEILKNEQSKACLLLVITAARLAELLDIADQRCVEIIDASFLSFIVLNNIDEILLENLNLNTKKLEQLMSRLVSHTKCTQLVATGNMWHENLMKTFLQYTNCPLLLMSNYLEAAIYAKCDFVIKICRNTKMKMDAVVKFMYKHFTTQLQKRIVVICSEEQEAKLVCASLLASGICAFAYTNNKDQDTLITLKEWKNMLTNQIMICTDHMLGGLRARSVQKLLHYSLPGEWNKFVSRFAILKSDNYNNYFKSDSILENINMNKELISYATLDATDMKLLPQLVKFMENHELEINHKLLDIVTQVMEKPKTGEELKKITFLVKEMNCLMTDQQSQAGFISLPGLVRSTKAKRTQKVKIQQQINVKNKLLTFVNQLEEREKMKQKSAGGSEFHFCPGFVKLTNEVIQHKQKINHELKMKNKYLAMIQKNNTIMEINHEQNQSELNCYFALTPKGCIYRNIETKVSTRGILFDIEWGKLTGNLQYVTLGTIENRSDIFVQLKSPKCIKKLNALEQLIEKRAAKLIPATVGAMECGQYYIICYENKLVRAQLQHIFAAEGIQWRTYRFLLLDYAKFLNIIDVADDEVGDVASKLNGIYLMRRDIAEFTACQAIHCTLANACLKQSLTILPGMNPGVKLLISAVKKNTTSVENLNINSYSCLIFNNIDDNALFAGSMINDVCIKMGLADLVA